MVCSKVNRFGGLILAGGEGRRMGYQNKGLLQFGEQKLIDPALQLLQHNCQYVAISANQDLACYQKFGVDVFTDIDPWIGCGPLAGVCSSVVKFPDTIDFIQVVPCDSPFLNRSVLEKLYQQLIDCQDAAVYAATASQQHPVMFQFRRSALAQLQDFLKQNQKHSIRMWLAQVEAKAVYFSDETLFANINDAASLQHYTPSPARPK